MALCKICGEDNCKKHSFLLGKTKTLKEFSGSSPPEIFVGRWNYPNVYAGILSPDEIGDMEILSSAELWHRNKLSIPEILSFRNKLVYGRKQSNIKQNQGSPFLSVLKEIAMAYKSVSTEFKLKKPITKNLENDRKVPLIQNAADVERVKLQENPKIKPKVDYLVNDTSAKAVSSILELDKAGIETSSIMKLLSAGLLGLKTNRKLVPTRWAISSIDSILSEKKIEKIKEFPQISEYILFHGEYIGNHYEIILIPRFWSFEVIERSMKSMGLWKDYESFFKRKTYASDVTGGYYAARLPVAEYLESIKKQASVLVIREVRPEYYSPLGVGILRQTIRGAFKQPPQKFNSLKDAFGDIQKRLKLPVDYWIRESQLLKSLQQKTLNSYL
jgi:hypothetical protein